jgi:N-acetylglucosaminyldiphosphoundecaprenol N-acetyl-beta-D-mannosaminyltransferase
MPPALRRTELFALDFVDAETEFDISAILQSPAEFAHRVKGGLPLVVTPNVDQLVNLAQHASPEAAAIINQAAYVLPDGQPVIWASRLLGAPLGARLAGSTLIADLWPALLAKGRRIFVVASSDTVAQRVRAEAGSDMAAIVAPMFPPGQRTAITEFAAGCADHIAVHKPEFVFVTLGFPKQCLLIGDIIERCKADGTDLPLFFAIGGSFDMYYGLKKRAPAWMQRVGMEWFYRFAQEPRRLFHRYFVQDPYFAVLTWREWQKRRAARQPVGATKP